LTPTEPTVAVAAVPAGKPQNPDLDVLDAIQHRVLWLATAIVRPANARHPGNPGVSVPG